MNELEALYRTQKDRFVKVARRMVPNNDFGYAEDAVQEAFFKALKYGHTRDKSKPIDAWIFTIMCNCCSDMRQKDTIKTIPMDKLPELSLPGGEDGYEVNNLIEHLLKKRRPDHKEVLRLWLNHQLKPSEINYLTTLNPTNIRRIMSDFRKDLEKHVGG